MKIATLVGLLGLLAQGACGEPPLGLADQVAAVDDVDGRPQPAIDPPEARACVTDGFVLGEWECPGHPGCARCVLQDSAGDGSPPNGCITPTGHSCIDFCEYCPADPGPAS